MKEEEAREAQVSEAQIAVHWREGDDRVIGALTDDLGVSAWYRPLNDITSAQGKIGGAAQKRLAGGAVLHYVTMAYDIDVGAMTPGVAHRLGEAAGQGGFRARSSGSTRCVGRPGCRG